MQVIISMFSLKSKYTKNEEVLQTFREMENRIQSMSLVHHKLYQSKNLSRIDLRDYIMELANLLLSSFGIPPNKVSFNFELENIPVLIDIAIPCGLILNELITNALKHAFPGDAKGEINIHLSKSNEIINLNVFDNGIGVPDNFNFRENSNLGLRLVFGLVENQLKGNIKIESNNGVLCYVRFKDILYRARV
jgi:two-component sensor histidine kinase